MQRRALLACVAALTAAVAFGFGAAAFDAVPTDQSPPSPSGDIGDTSGGGGGGAGKTVSGPSDGRSGGCVFCVPSARSLVAGFLPSINPLALVGVTAVVVIASAVGLGLHASEDAPVVEDPSDDGTDVTGDGERTAATSSPADAAATNDVYRAWAALTDRVSVSTPSTTTPREYAAAAVDAGFDPDAVARLTDAFASVRYGGAEPTDEREREAQAALDDAGPDR